MRVTNRVEEAFRVEEKYKVIDFPYRATVEQSVLMLLEHKEKGELVCGSFNGTMLYSDTVTMEGAYREIVGVTKEEMDESRNRARENYLTTDAEYRENLPLLIESWVIRGRKIIEDTKWGRWSEIVNISLNGFYRGMELKYFLAIAEILNGNGSLSDAYEELTSQNHSGMTYGLVCALVEELCGRGDEFMAYIELRSGKTQAEGHLNKDRAEYKEVMLSALRDDPSDTNYGVDVTVDIKPEQESPPVAYVTYKGVLHTELKSNEHGEYGNCTSCGKTCTDTELSDTDEKAEGE